MTKNQLGAGFEIKLSFEEQCHAHACDGRESADTLAPAEIAELVAAYLEEHPEEAVERAVEAQPPAVFAKLLADHYRSFANRHDIWGRGTAALRIAHALTSRVTGPVTELASRRIGFYREEMRRERSHRFATADI